MKPVAPITQSRSFRGTAVVMDPSSGYGRLAPQRS